MQGNHTEALACYRQALVIKGALEDRRGEANTRFNLSLSLFEIGKRSEALIEAQTALDLYESLEDPTAVNVREALAEWQSEASDQ